MTRETAAVFARAADEAVSSRCGLGRVLGKLLLHEKCAYPEASLVRMAAEADIPCTIHVALGTDIVHMHDCVSGATPVRQHCKTFAYSARSLPI